MMRMSAPATRDERIPVSGEENVVITLAAEGTPAEKAIRRVGRFGKLKELSLGFLIDQVLATHEELRARGKEEQYAAEDETIRQVERLRSAGWCVLLNDSAVDATRLDRLTITDFVREISDRSAKYGVAVRIREVPAEETSPPAAVAEPQPAIEAAVAAESAVAAEPETTVRPEDTVGAEAAAPASRAVEAPAAAEETHQKKEYLSKHDLLTGEYRQAVDELNLNGLFVGNLSSEERMDPRVFPFLHQKEVSKLLMRANRLLQDGSCDKALELYGLLAEGEPENADYRLLQGRALLFAGEYEKGVAVLREAEALGEPTAGSIARRIQSFKSLTGSYPATTEGLRNLMGELRPRE